MPTNQIKQLCNELLTIENQLEQLSRQYASVYETYDGELFLEQHQLAANQLDNLVLAATHEAASNLGFMRQNLYDLTQFITFRTQFSQFTDQEIEQILDNPSLSATEKMRLKAKCDAIIPQMNKIQSTWQALFKQQSYAKIKTKLHI
jgi:hypothetical protein